MDDKAIEPHGKSEQPPRLRLHAPLKVALYLVSAAIALALLIGDIILPRGATVAIGYCVIPIIVASTRRRDFLLGVTIICTILTWVGYWTEPPGAQQWMSIFDRCMVSGVLWLTAALVWRRTALIETLMQQTAELQNAKRELERSNAELERFAGVVAHDIRSPLNTIGLLAQLLRGPGPRDPADCTTWAGAISTEVERTNGLIQHLLRYSSVGSGEVKLSACDCQTLLDEVRQSLRAQIESIGAVVSNDPLPTVRADRALLAELFQNLIENSIKYRGDASPRIHVSAEERDGAWVFFVRDNGIGVRREDAAKIFEPFRQGRHHAGGVGLGLATCKRIVERHGGTIEVESEPGAGAIFRFTIPRPPRGATETTAVPQLTTPNTAGATLPASIAQTEPAPQFQPHAS